MRTEVDEEVECN